MPPRLSRSERPDRLSVTRLGQPPELRQAHPGKRRHTGFCSHQRPRRVMSQRTVTIASSVGLHARPAALFVQAATATGLPVQISKSGEEPVDARSILGVMALGAKCGEEVLLTADGDGADAALDELVTLLSRDLDAQE